MTKYSFATKSGKAYYWNTIPGFIKDDSSSIISQLVRAAFEVGKEQSDAWDNQIKELQARLNKCEMEGNIIFEYDIIRLGKRIDVVLLIRHMVFSLEFKNGKNVFTAQDARQAEDYAIDIKYQNKGYGTEALIELGNLLKTEYGVKRMTTTYIWGNEHAKHVYEKVGFIETDVVNEPDCHEVNMKWVL